MEYQKTKYGGVIRKSDNAFIPDDISNVDWVQYQEWLAAGNTPEPAAPEPKPSMDSLRAQAYQQESDPIFFKYQRGEATKEEWLAKIAEIKNKYPE